MPRAALVAATVVIFAVHPVLTSGPLPLWLIGIVDEVGHVATAAILVAAWPVRLGRPLVLVALASSVAIDADHALQYLGTDVLTEGTVRPYPHSLATPVLALAAAAALRGTPRSIALGVTAGVLAHLFRDLATGPGVPLLWPVSDAAVRIPWPVYGGAMVVLTAFAWTAARRLPQVEAPAP